MKFASNIISSFWTDRIFSAAALKTIRFMEKNKTYKEILKTSSFIIIKLFCSKQIT